MDIFEVEQKERLGREEIAVRLRRRSRRAPAVGLKRRLEISRYATLTPLRLRVGLPTILGLSGGLPSPGRNRHGPELSRPVEIWSTFAG